MTELDTLVTGIWIIQFQNSARLSELILGKNINPFEANFWGFTAETFKLEFFGDFLLEFDADLSLEAIVLELEAAGVQTCTGPGAIINELGQCECTIEGTVFFPVTKRTVSTEVIITRVL